MTLGVARLLKDVFSDCFDAEKAGDKRSEAETNRPIIVG